MQEDTPIVETRGRAAFDYPTRRRKLKTDEDTNSVHTASKRARSIASTGQVISSIQSEVGEAQRLPGLGVSHTRINQGGTFPFVASSIVEESDTERGLSNMPMGPGFLRDVSNEPETLPSTSIWTVARHTDPSDHFIADQNCRNDTLRGLSPETGQQYKASTIAPLAISYRAPLDIDQIPVPVGSSTNDNFYHGRHHAEVLMSSPPTMMTTQTDLNDYNLMQGIPSEALSTLISTDVSRSTSTSAMTHSLEQRGASTQEIESFQIQQHPTVTENQVVHSANHSQTQSTFFPEMPATLSSNSVSTAHERQWPPRDSPNIQPLEPYGPGNLNLYGDFPWLDDGSTEKSSEMDIELSWEDYLLFPSHPDFSLTESGDSTSGSGFTPPSDDNGGDATAQ